ncbi:MAG TPA: RdgB/HAM1 family non-canonical purine NTP pyrophosphatase, partial [Dehalococcoidia bacterium]|nr:RdgB/HAM1 family non-canonical purine NTP pyrophosphatase [Dehalococcoidia bacterium]
PKLLLATRNAGKAREYSLLLQRSPFELTTLDAEGIQEDVTESGKTLQENARLKAVGYAVDDRFLVMADDSGLEVDALGGAPGPLSARFAGKGASDRDKVNLLLSKLRGVPWEERSARFRCVIAIASERKVIGLCEGVCEGIISFEAEGDHGFGYDPVFYLPELDRTMAELTLEEKNKVSHRAKAAEKAVRVLKRIRQEIDR